MIEPERTVIETWDGTVIATIDIAVDPATFYAIFGYGIPICYSEVDTKGWN